MKKKYLLLLQLVLAMSSVRAQSLLSAQPVQKDLIETGRKKMLDEVFADNRFIGGYFLYLSFFHDFNIAAMETHSRTYKPEVSKRLIFYCLNGLDQINDELVNNYMGRGIGRLDSGKYADAMNDFDKVLAYDPNNADAYVNRAILFIISSQYDEASAELVKAKKFAPINPVIFFNESVISLARNNYTLAMKKIDSCITLDPEYGRAYFEKGLILRGLNQYKEAIKVLRKARSLDDPDAGALIKKIKDDQDQQTKPEVKSKSK